VLVRLRAPLEVTMLALFVGLVSLLSPQQPVLAPGSPAPKLEVKTWVKGEPIAAFAPDRTYAVEFWATWCGPCIESIPHLTELAKQRSAVTFIGVSVWEDNDKEQVPSFVAKMGDKMGYAVAYGGNKDGTAANWLAAAKQTGIPCAFVVERGVVQWIGHPSGLDTVLQQLADKTFDLAAAKQKFDAALAAREVAQKLQAEIEACAQLFDAGDRKGAHARLAEVRKAPNGKAMTAELQFVWLAIEDEPAWRAAATARMNESENARTDLAMFLEPNALRATAACTWLLAELTSGRYPANWYPWLCGGRMHRVLRHYDDALACAARSREVILAFRKANPDATQGNALDVIGALEERIRKEQAAAGK